MKNVSPFIELVDVDAHKTRVDAYLDFSLVYMSGLFLIVIITVLIFGLIH